MHSSNSSDFFTVKVLRYTVKFCSYNIVLNEAPDNNDIEHIANIMLNKTPNSNDAMRIGNNVHLTAVGAQQLSMVAI